jgi:hypothetical protein
VSGVIPATSSPSCRTCPELASVHIQIWGDGRQHPLTAGAYCTQHGRLVASEARLRGFDAIMRGLR